MSDILPSSAEAEQALRCLNAANGDETANALDILKRIFLRQAADTKRNQRQGRQGLINIKIEVDNKKKKPRNNSKGEDVKDPPEVVELARDLTEIISSGSISLAEDLFQWAITILRAHAPVTYYEINKILEEVCGNVVMVAILDLVCAAADRTMIDITDESKATVMDGVVKTLIGNDFPWVIAYLATKSASGVGILLALHMYCAASRSDPLKRQILPQLLEYVITNASDKFEECSRSLAHRVIDDVLLNEDVAGLEYLVLIATLSSSVARVSFPCILDLLNVTTIVKLYEKCAGNERISTEIDNLITNCMFGWAPAAFKVIMLLDSVMAVKNSDKVPKDLSKTARQACAQIMWKLGNVAHTWTGPAPVTTDHLAQTQELAVLESLTPHAKQLVEHLLANQSQADGVQNDEWAILSLPLEVLRLVGLYRGQDTVSDILEWLLLSVATGDAMEQKGTCSYFINLLISYETKWPHSVRALLERVLDRTSQYTPMQTLAVYATLLDLVLFQQKHNHAFNPISGVVSGRWHAYLRSVMKSPSAENPAVIYAVLRFLREIRPRPNNVDAIPHLAYLVDYFGVLMKRRTYLYLSGDRGDSCDALSNAILALRDIIPTAADIPEDRNVLITQILEIGIGETYMELFNIDMLMKLPQTTTMNTAVGVAAERLLDVNRARDTRSRQHYHSGYIGNIPRLVSKSNPTTPSVNRDVAEYCVAYNTDMLLNLLWACLGQTSMSSAADAETDQKHILGDRHIRKWFAEHPASWNITSLIAEVPTELCSLLWVVKAMLATLIGECDRGLKRNLVQLPMLMRRAEQMMEILSKAAWVPSPLCDVGDLFPFLTCADTKVILYSVFCFLCENPPSPGVFSYNEHAKTYERNFPPGCANANLPPVKSALRRHIAKLGCMYARFFPAVPDDEQLAATPKL